MVPPMSTTTTSPTSSVRSLSSWCGLAAFGPEATMVKSAHACPSATIAAAMAAPTSRSVRPGRSRPGTCSCTRSIAAPAPARAATSAALLRIRSSRSAGLASTCSAPGSAARSRSTIIAHIRSARPTRLTRARRLATSAYGSCVSSHATSSTPRWSTPAACAAGSSRRGTTMKGASRAGTTRQVRRSKLGAS